VRWNPDVGAVYHHLAHGLQLIHDFHIEQPGNDQEISRPRHLSPGRFLIRFYQTGAVIGLVMKPPRNQDLFQSGPIYLAKLASRGSQIPEELEIGLLHLPVSGGAAAEELAGCVKLLVNLNAAYQA
jgi:hypothetical protein